MLVSDSDSDRVGPWTKGYLRTTTDGSGQVGNREGLLSCGSHFILSIMFRMSMVGRGLPSSERGNVN